MALGDAFPGVSGGADSVEARKALAGLVIRSTSGVARAGVFPRHGDPLLSARSDMKVDVAAFEGISVRGGGPNFMANDGVVQVTIPTAPVANSVLHVVYFKQNESAAPFADANDLPIFGVLSSAAAPIPSKPDVATVPGAVELGTVLVPAGATATNQVGVTITGTHQFTATTGGWLWFRTVAEMNAVTTLPQYTRALVLADGGEYVRGSAAWLPTRLRGVQGVVIPSANTDVDTDIVFAMPFASAPVVVATPSSTIASVGVSMVTASGFRLTTRRTTTTSTVVQWVAVQ